MLNMIVVVTAFALTQVQIQSSATDTSLTVSATRPIRIAAGAASMYAVIEGTSETATGAIAKGAEKAKAVTDSLSRLGKRAVWDRPIPYRLSPIIPQAGYGGYPNPSSGGFINHVLVRVRVPNIQDLAIVQASILSAGAVGITGQTFETAEADSTWAQNIKALGNAARTAASALAEEQGKRLGRVIVTNSNAYGNSSQSGQITLDPRSQSYGGPPESSITTTYSITFQLQPVR
jgi:uncharacterized protein YggE